MWFVPLAMDQEGYGALRDLPVPAPDEDRTDRHAHVGRIRDESRALSAGPGH
ncbi:hypothetical protein [Actinacidiphila glaucinigra]|uniref:hypothetical protein n=1 Tax=Actinacidiphila glaucinigra TaxID=235986 RepID=UPI0029B4EDED|nr:hypothetical protein [Streptomyces sp. PA03-3a]